MMILQQHHSQPAGISATPQLSRDFEVVLHVGYPKTASTWLQETVFSNPDAGFVCPWNNSDCRARSASAFITVNSFSDDVAYARSFFDEGLQHCADGLSVPVISDEALVGDPLQRQYPGRYTADRVHSAFPRAKVLIGVREQKTIAVSMYREYIRHCGIFPLEVFLGRGDEALGFTPILQPDYLEYHRVVGYYQKLYGRDNVLVLPMESLQKDPHGFVESILKFCQCRGKIERPAGAVGVGWSAAALEVKRWLNPLVQPSPLVPAPSTRSALAVYRLSSELSRRMPKSWSAPLERRWKDIAARRYEGMFRDSNRRLSELTGIDFATLGYEC